MIGATVAVDLRPTDTETTMSAQKTLLGRLLQERREALGYSRTRAGEAVGIPPGTIEGWEIGRVAKPPIHDVFRLARLLRISGEEIEAAVIDAGAVEPPPPQAPPSEGAAPLLEQAIALFGWSDDQAAAALRTKPGKVRAWRRGALEMTLPELMTVAAMIGLHAAGAVPNDMPTHEVAKALAHAGAEGDPS